MNARGRFWKRQVQRDNFRRLIIKNLREESFQFNNLFNMYKRAEVHSCPAPRLKKNITSLKPFRFELILSYGVIVSIFV